MHLVAAVRRPSREFDVAANEGTNLSSTLLNSPASRSSTGQRSTLTRRSHQPGLIPWVHFSDAEMPRNRSPSRSPAATDMVVPATVGTLRTTKGPRGKFVYLFSRSDKLPRPTGMQRSKQSCDYQQWSNMANMVGGRLNLWYLYLVDPTFRRT